MSIALYMPYYIHHTAEGILGPRGGWSAYFQGPSSAAPDDTPVTPKGPRIIRCVPARGNHRQDNTLSPTHAPSHPVRRLLQNWRITFTT